jgi:hypothetical protein
MFGYYKVLPKCVVDGARGKGTTKNNNNGKLRKWLALPVGTDRFFSILLRSAGIGPRVKGVLIPESRLVKWGNN